MDFVFSLIVGAFTQDHRFLGNGIGGSSHLTGTKNIAGWPQFEANVARNVTIAVGQTAFLHCRVYQLGDKEVSFFFFFFLKIRFQIHGSSANEFTFSKI
jgi:hypothetical protein